MKFSRPRYGFTLVEIMIAMLIASVLTLGLGAVFTQARGLYSSTEVNRDIFDNISRLTGAIRGEIACCYLPKLADGNDVGFELAQRTDGGFDLSFFTMCPGWQLSGIYAKPAMLKYSWAKNDDGQMELVRENRYAAGGELIGEASAETLFVLFDKIVCQVYAVDSDDQQKRWIDNYVSKDKLPDAIKFNFKLAGIDKDFQCMLMLNCQGNLAGDGED